MTYDYQTIRFDIQSQVATLTLARPDRMNALTPSLLAEACDAVSLAVARGSRALLITGEGRAFCSGADLGSGEAALPDDLGALLDEHYHPFVTLLANLPIPIVTAINGPAVGAGMGLALLGDISLIARSSYLMMAFVNIGLVPDAGTTWLVSHAVGRAKALELALLGERIAAETAVAFGLVTRIAEDADLLGEAGAIAKRLAEGPTVALGLIRKQVAAALALPFEAALAVERDHQRRAGHSADFREAVEAFRAKRLHRFRGA